jgi:hypothetical protein
MIAESLSGARLVVEDPHSVIVPRVASRRKPQKTIQRRQIPHRHIGLFQRPLDPWLHHHAEPRRKKPAAELRRRAGTRGMRNNARNDSFAPTSPFAKVRAESHPSLKRLCIYVERLPDLDWVFLEERDRVTGGDGRVF